MLVGTYRSVLRHTQPLFARGRVRRCIHHQQSVQHALQSIRKQLQRANINPNDAKALIANVLHLPRSNDFVLHSNRQLNEEEAEKLRTLTNRRCEGEPLAYVLGKKEFWSMEFAVTPSTLIPRSDSEVLIETLVDSYPKQAPLRILDIGTGSGCLLLAALSEFPLATGIGIDVSEDALTIAAQNSLTNGLSHRATFIQKNLQKLLTLEPANDHTTSNLLYQQFNVILCNPPYIPVTEVQLIAPDVLAYEPHLALFSNGPDALKESEAKYREDDPQGLRMYRYVEQSVQKLFKPQRVDSTHSKENSMPTSLLLEIGSEEQAHAVRLLFAKNPSLVFQKFLIDGQLRHRGLLFQSPS